MAERIQRVEEVRETDTTGTTTQVVKEEPTKSKGSTVVARLIWFVAGVIITLLTLRFVFILLGANRGSGFVDFIYDVSHPFAAPFFGVFNYDLNYGESQVELSTLVAIAIYALIAWGIAYLVTIRNRR